MATDIAKIGFGVETSQLEKGVATLNSFSASAKAANSNAQSVGVAMNNAAKVFAAAVAGMSKSVLSLVSATKGVTTEQIAAAKEASDFADRIYRAAQAQDKLTTSTQKVTAAIKGQQSVLQKQLTIQQRINNLTGVTGLSGGSAFASYNVFKKEMDKREWAEAIGETPRDMMPNRFNTANIAAQFQDIGVTAAMGMNPLLVALQQGTQLSAVLNGMVNPLQNLKEGFLQIINPTSLWTIALTALTVAVIQTVDWTGLAQTSLNALASVFDYVSEHSDTFAAAIAGATVALVAFKGAAITSTIAAGFKTLLTILTSFGGVIFAVLTSPITLTIAAVVGLIAIFTNFKDEINEFFGFDFVGVVKSAVNSMVGMFVGALRNVYDLFKWLWDKAKELFGGDEVNRSLLDTFANNMNESMNFDYIGGASDLVSSAASTASAKLKEWSSGLSEMTDEAKKAKEAWEDLIKYVAEKKAELQLQKSTMGMNIFDTAMLETQSDLLKKLGVTDINQLSPDKQASIKQWTQEIADMTTEVEILQNQFDFAKDSTKGFFSDLKSGLMEGQSLWESFGNAVVNVLEKIIDKMLDVGVDMLFAGFKGAGGWSSTSEGGFASFFSDMFSFNAKGGVYTNGVYNSPTLFKFANGGKFGVMGEAGPEAVMPLQRGPDGSLGVRADGINSNGGDVVVNVINNSNAQATVNQRQTSQGTEIDVMIDQMMAEKMVQPGTASNSALTVFNNRKLIAR